MSERPNFLIIMSDQHAPETMGGIGHPAVQTPSLDRLMSAGVTFRNSYCPYPMCTPSRAGFMTGRLTPEHGFWSKLNFYEESVRVPFIVAPPDCANAGAQCEAPVSIIDWMTTVLDLTGQQAAFEDLPGCSLLPLIEDPSLLWPDRAVLSDYACDGTRVPMRMVRRGRWKAWFALGFPPLLFDLEKDPNEWDDLGGEASSRDILEDLYTVVCSDGWDAEALRNEILLHKHRLKYIHEAESDSAG